LLRPFALSIVAACIIAACERTVPTVSVPPSPSPPLVVTGDRPAAELFAAVRTGTGGAPMVFGSYTRGCVAGAEQLPLDAPRWQVMRPSRNRAWGHPALIKFVRHLADDVAKDGVRGLLIGDLGQPRGGPSPSDHNSHQAGLDADVWLTPMPSTKVAAGALETFAPVAMVDFSTLRVTADFGAAQVSMLSRAAQADEVERIFVSPPIKRALCQRVKGDRSWLRKVRPWPGHYWHMHVRLGCPTDSPDCKPQEAPPPGDGCGGELQSWFAKPDWARPSEGTYEPDNAIRLDALPDACRRLLVERG
jgi:penicillin-insensitive murein DD-endopeptidase